MAKSKSKKRDRRERAFPPGPEKTPKPSKMDSPIKTRWTPKKKEGDEVAPTSYQQGPRWGLIFLFLTIAIGGTFLAINLRPKGGPPRFTYQLSSFYLHDANAFTQGLVLHDGFFWESTGRYGESTFRKVEVESGKTIQQVKLDEKYFGEGLAVHGDKFYQLTWRENKCFVYNKELELIEEFEYDGEGWGLTSNGKHLIMSNGSSELLFIEPRDFTIVNRIRVHRKDRRVGPLNELEYIGGKIFANEYLTDYIYEIDPNTGDVTRLINLSGLWPKRERPEDGTLNGIAFNPDTKKLMVTGKLCPRIYEIELVPENQ